MPSRTLSPRTPAGTMPASTASSVHGVNVKSSQRCRAQPEVVAAYAAELAEDGKSMSTIRLAVAAIVDAHRSVGLESPQTAGVSETLRGLSRQVGVSQKQARPLDADALAAIRATVFTPRKNAWGLA